MLKIVSSTRDLGSAPTICAIDPDIEALHGQSAVYTNPTVVAQILDAIGWTNKADLSSARLLEPAGGDGAFIVASAERLIQSMRRHGAPLTASNLRDRIATFEIHPNAVARARTRVSAVLTSLGVASKIADLVAARWIVCEDFLLTQLTSGSFSHVAGNPPYARWSKIPADLRKRYERRLPTHIAKGDLFLPFLDRSIECLQPGGRLGFICSDRWKFMAFADDFRSERMSQVTIERDQAVSSSGSFARDVGVCASILILKRTRPKPAPQRPTRLTLTEAGYEIRVGPALGCAAAFVLGAEDHSVEPDLLTRWIDNSEIKNGEIIWQGRHIITMHDDKGILRALKDYPLAAKRLRKFRTALTNRSIVRKGAIWYRPIDRVMASVWKRPKLLVPELARVPRIALDLSGAIPSHATYAIFSPNDDLESLYSFLKNGKLEQALKSSAPKVKGGHLRCYKRFLEQIPIG